MTPRVREGPASVPDDVAGSESAPDPGAGCPVPVRDGTAPPHSGLTGRRGCPADWRGSSTCPAPPKAAPHPRQWLGPPQATPGHCSATSSPAAAARPGRPARHRSASRWVPGRYEWLWSWVHVDAGATRMRRAGITWACCARRKSLRTRGEPAGESAAGSSRPSPSRPRQTGSRRDRTP